jgi:signal transduction histidine kinase
MANLLASILALADMDTGNIRVNRTAVPVEELLSPLQAELAPQASAKGIGLDRVGSSLTVLTDAGLMSAILRNLVANSVRYTERGRVLMGARRRGDWADLIVGDTGIGIQAAHQSAIFEEFYQVGNTERDFAAGTGVGLAIVRRLVDVLGHDVKVQSCEGRGSLFTVTVPLA